MGLTLIKLKYVFPSPRPSGDFGLWRLGLKQHLSVKVMITCSFMLHGSIHRRRVNWQRLMWRGGGTAALLTGEIIANKATPIWMIDRLRGRPWSRPALKYKQYSVGTSIHATDWLFTTQCTLAGNYVDNRTQTIASISVAEVIKRSESETEMLFLC